MFHRCSALKLAANAGMAVPVTPTDIFRNIIAGLTDAMTDALPIAGGRGLSATPFGPSPIPRGPWQDAHVA